MISGINLTKREKGLLMVAFLAMMAYLFYTYAYIPQHQTITLKNNEARELRQKYINILKLDKDKEMFDRELQKINGQLAPLTAALPNDSNTSLLAGDIEKNAAQNNVNFVEFKPGPAMNNKNYLQIPVHISVSGTYNNLTNFVQGLDNSPKILTYRSWVMKANPNLKTEDYTLDLDITAFTGRS